MRSDFSLDAQQSFKFRAKKGLILVKEMRIV